MFLVSRQEEKQTPLIYILYACHFRYYPLLITLPSKINHFNLFSCFLFMRFSSPFHDNPPISC